MDTVCDGNRIQPDGVRSGRPTCDRILNGGGYHETPPLATRRVRPPDGSTQGRDVPTPPGCRPCGTIDCAPRPGSKRQIGRANCSSRALRSHLPEGSTRRKFSALCGTVRADGGSVAGVPRLPLTRRTAATVAAPEVCHDEHRPPVAHDSCQRTRGRGTRQRARTRHRNRPRSLCLSVQRRVSYPVAGSSRR